jgi:hypothetical protein
MATDSSRLNNQCRSNITEGVQAVNASRCWHNTLVCLLTFVSGSPTSQQGCHGTDFTNVMVLTQVCDGQCAKKRCSGAEWELRRVWFAGRAELAGGRRVAAGASLQCGLQWSILCGCASHQIYSGAVAGRIRTVAVGRLLMARTIDWPACMAALHAPTGNHSVTNWRCSSPVDRGCDNLLRF